MEEQNTTQEEYPMVVLSNFNPMEIYDKGQVDQVLSAIEKEARSFVPNVDTAKGRGEVKSMAYKITRSKTLLDDAGKKAKHDAQEKVKKIDSERKKLRDQLDVLRDEIRTPLTRFEEAEKLRKEKLQNSIDMISQHADLDYDGEDISSAQIKDRISALKFIKITDYEDMKAEAAVAKEEALNKLEDALTDITEKEKKERQRLEDERLMQEAEEKRKEEERKAQEERRRKEQEERLREAEERARREAEEEAKRKAEQAARDAEIAREEAERKAKEELERVRKEEEAKRQAILDKQREDEKRARILQQEKEAAEEKARAEEERRQKNKRHRSAINKQIIASLVSHGIDDKTAKAITTEMANGRFPYVTVNY